jgi:hypothetical protein
MTGLNDVCRRSDRGGILAWLALTFLVISIGLVCAGVFFVHRIKVHESREGKDVQIETPLGSVHVQHGDASRAAGIGIPIYPGARQIKDGESARVDLSGAFGDKDLQIIAGKWETTDPLDKVQKYYEDKFPDMNVTRHDNKVEMHSIKGHAKRVIALRERGIGTEISLASVGEPKAN